jgi:predicted DCC family thiol-disulfide oxidoreductase YuxK
LPYDKGAVKVSHDRTRVVWTVDRTWPDRAQGSLAIALDSDAVGSVAEDPLAIFLTSRWRLYAATRGGRVVTAPVEHEPWPLSSARFIGADTGLATNAQLPVSGDPIVHHATAVRVRVGLPKFLPRRRASGGVTVWFDDDCGVCSASVRWLRKRTDPTVAFRPNRELDNEQLRASASDAIVVTDADDSWTAIDAVAIILDRSGRFGRLAAFGLRLPVVHAVAGVAYRWVAANRARLSARLGLAAGCDLPKSTS